MVTNVKIRSVIELLPDRNKATIIKYLASVPDKHKIRLVAMDMWNPYREAVQHVLPSAQVVIDKFLIQRMANMSMEIVRKRVRAGLTDRQSRTLMHDRFLLLRRRKDLTAQEFLKLEAWTGYFPLLSEAYWLKEAFFDIWKSTSAQNAMEQYEAWHHTIPANLTDDFQPIMTAMHNWYNEIFAHFTYGRATNAYTETVNGFAKLISRIGRGYSFEAIRAKILYGNGLQTRPKYNRRLGQEHHMALPGPDDDKFISLGNSISTLILDLKRGLPLSHSTQ